MNKDTYREILYHLDINDIATFRMAAKDISICKDASFWINLFNRDHVVLYHHGNDYQEWIHEYRKSVKASQMATDMLNLLIKEASNSMVNRFSYGLIPLDMIAALLPIEITEQYPVMTGNLVIHTVWKNNKFKFDILLGQLNKMIELSREELLKLLFKFFYHMPTINITDHYKDPYIVNTSQNIEQYISRYEMNPYYVRRKLLDRQTYWRDKL